MIKSKFSRRRFLAGVGAGLSATAASSLIPSFAWATDSLRPQRFVIYFVPHGWPIELAGVFGDGSSWLDDNTILGAFADWQDKVSVVRGVSQTNGGGHGSVHRVLSGGYGKDSVDTTIAKAMDDRPWLLGTVSHDYFSRANFENNKHMQEIALPLDFVDQAFGDNFDNPGVITPETRFRSELLSMSERQLENLSARLQNISKERNRVSSHIESVREVKARNDRGVPGGATGIDVDELKARLANTEGLDGKDQQNTTAILDGHIDAMATAIIAGAVKVGTIRNHGSGHNYVADFAGGPGVPGNAHMNSHAGNAQRRIDEYGKNLRWYLDRLATFIDRLDVVDPLDPQHTVLENTTILYTSEFCDGSHVTDAKDISTAGGTHYTYFPMVLIGGGAGKLSTGGVIDVDASHHDVLQTLAHIHGGERNEGNILNELLI